MYQASAYIIASPFETHWRPATCEEVWCPHYRLGWRIRIEHLMPQHEAAIYRCGKKFVRIDVLEGESYYFFEAGQPCFQADHHRVLNGTPEIFAQRNLETGRLVRHSGPDAWINASGEHAEHLRKTDQRSDATLARESV